MKFYHKCISVLTLGILGVLLMFLCSSCKVFKTNSTMLTIEQAAFYKTFGGQGRSRNINFELITKESLALIDAKYSLEVDGFKVELKIYQEGEKSKLLGYYTENRASREVEYDKHSLFDKIPFTNIKLKVKEEDKTTDISIDKIENKPTKYYP